MRYENKFTFDGTQYQRVTDMILSSRHMFNEVYHIRQVNNIYMDTATMSNYHDNLNGNYNRVKHRIRWYDDVVDVKNPILEYKIKHGEMGYKRSYRMPSFCLEDFDYSRYLPQIGTYDTNREHDYATIEGELSMRVPTLHNRYQRIYYMSADSLFRITIDWDIEYSKPLWNCTSIMTNKDKKIVVELKYEQEHRMQAADVVQSLGFDFRLTSNSKYSTGISLLY